MAFSRQNDPRLTRRNFLKNLGVAPLLLRASPFYGSPLFGLPERSLHSEDALSFSEVRYSPRYPSRSPLENVLRLVAPGSDEYLEERYAFEIGAALKQLGVGLKTRNFSGWLRFVDASMQALPLTPVKETPLRDRNGIKSVRREFSSKSTVGRDGFVSSLHEWVGHDTKVERADFEITALEAVVAQPLVVRATVRYEVVANGSGTLREHRTGLWITEWVRDGSTTQPGNWKARAWHTEAESVGSASGPVFLDVTQQALGKTDSYERQMLRGSDEWRTLLDGACGIDVYGNNGVAVGDFDNDGYDDLYVSQPAGLPNRLYHNRGDGTFDDVTDKAGVGVLDNTSCALFADFRNSGFQDLLVVCGNGPLLFLNQENGTFVLKRDAFQFARVPQGTFTHAAVSDYDRDGRLDIYFCLYSYYLGLDQYHYPVPYFDARNGPPNFLLHNEGDAKFVDRTDAAGLNVDNDRYSFACAWGESVSNNLPDLYVVNDFGRNNLYRNNGDGTFSIASTKAHVEDVGAGMSAAWADVNNDGSSDLYVANMWSAAGQRVSQQARFHEIAPSSVRELYKRHARGNGLFENRGDGTFRSMGEQAGVEAGRWAWCSDFWDFDHDGYPDLYVTNGYISAQEPEDRRTDLGSFFWRQVVAKSPEDSTPSLAYEHGWNALNELIRSNNSWSGFERNVMFANNGDGTFSDVSGAVGLDFLEDGRSFALADFDHDGRLEVVVKNRNAPQLRILHNAMKDIGDSVAFRLRGTKSNRDGIGTAITVETGALRQTKYLQAGSGFLAQHSKELFFGLGLSKDPVHATVRWPNGLTQRFESLPRNHAISLEEGKAAFEGRAFLPSAMAYAQVASPMRSDQDPFLPEGIETWLVDPLKAPVFSLPDPEGRTWTLKSLSGDLTLLYFWATTSPLSSNQLSMLHEQRAMFAASQLKVLALNVDLPEDADRVRAFLKQKRLSLTVLLASEEVAGIYNIIYRYLFDRRRDLPLPTSFLLDRNGLIVKIYQGPLKPERLVEDVRSIPSTPADRMLKALPFPGKLYQSDFVRNDYTYGVAMFQHGYLEQAEASFRQVVAAKPNDAEGYYNLGTLNLRKNDFAQARVYLQQTLKLKPDYPEAWNNLGMMAAQESRFEEAIQNFQQSLLLRPGYATALLNLGNVYRRQGDASRAKDSLTRALSLQPDDPEANYSLGMFYAQQNQLQTAEDYLRKAVTLRPDYPEALNNLGVLYVRRQDYARAEEQFKLCIRIVPGFDQSYINLARLYVLQNDKEKAKGILRDLLHLHPESASGKQAMQMLESAP